MQKLFVGVSKTNGSCFIRMHREMVLFIAIAVFFLKCCLCTLSTKGYSAVTSLATLAADASQPARGNRIR